jgi:hypothetical protein
MHDEHDFRIGRDVDLVKTAEVNLWDDEHVAWIDWISVHESKHTLPVVDDRCRLGAANEIAERTGHRLSSSGGSLTLAGRPNE